MTSRALNPHDLSLTPAACARVRTIAETEGREGLMFRVSVSGGGCSGFQYGFDFDTDVHDDDSILDQGGVTLIIDEASLDILRGSQVDFTETLMAAAFVVKNPNATSTCGCGTSFSI